MAYPTAKIVWFDSAGIRQLRFDETEHYLVMKEFMADPQAFLAARLTLES
jgi:predicted ATPase